MWKVIIADDEQYMLEALEKLIDWEELDCQIVSVVKNGKELIEKIEEETPDIVITDIKMPLVSGIEAAKYVYDRMLPTRVIILSAYEDFDFAREVILYDVCGYVVKTSVMEEMPFMVRRAIEKLSKAENDREEMESSNDIIKEVQRYISGHYTEKITLTKLAEEIHVNGSYLSRLYKLKTGQNLFEFINQMRVEQAKVLIGQGKRISETAQLVGFENSAYFSRVFKKIEGVSPREYGKVCYGKEVQD